MTHQERQKEQSREWIADAFFRLLEKKPYEAITVSEIARKADLSRRTVYRAFADKRDILMYLFERLWPDYIAAMQALGVRKREQLAVVIVEFVNRNMAFFQMLRRNGLEHLIVEFFDSHLGPGRDQIWGQPFSADPEVERVFMMTISVEHYNIIRLWLELCEQKTPQQMAELISDALALFQNFQ